jgi:hypothetical protein
MATNADADADADADVDVDAATFRGALQGLHRGDFSWLEPLFTAGTDPADKPRIIRWHEAGRFRDEPQALAEALTCACFLGRTGVAEYLLTHGVEPSGGMGTGLNAFHWASNRGQLAAVRLLIRAKAPLETRNMYGGTILGGAVWAALHETKPDHPQVVEALLEAGARVEEAEYPTGDARIDAILARYRSR